MRAAVRAFAAVALCAVAVESTAFVPPTSFILRRMGAKLSGMRGVTAQLGGVLDAEGGPVATEGKLYVAAPDRVRLELQAPGVGWTEVWSGTSKTLVRGTTPERSTARAAHPLAGLFLGNARTYLRELGVDASQVTLGRLGSTICWVIGGKAEDTSRPQLWIDKETFLPARLLSFEGEGDGRRAVDWRFADYDAGQGFPRGLELRIAGRRVLRVGLVTLDTARVPPESTFSAQ